MNIEQVDRAEAHLEPPAFAHGEEFALEMDAIDPLADYRSRFELPGGGKRVYLLGNSLGPLPRDVRAQVDAELDAWAARGVESYFEPPRKWYEADTRHVEEMAGIVGAVPAEIALAGSLTTNLHLLFASFFRPTGDRRRILVERPAFPSDRYLVETQLAWHGIDPDDGIIEVGGPEYGPMDDGVVEQVLAERGDEIALVFLGGVNYLSGQALDIPSITQAAHAAGAVVGYDLAHAAGNVQMALHEWDVDFAAWCTYKYLNSGPGAVGGLFVNEKHATDRDRFRLGGWWGVDPQVRFLMTEADRFVPRADAAGWQHSCPPVLAMAALGPALGMFEEAGMEALRAKSERLTGYLEWLLSEADTNGRRLEQITPAEPARRGAQLSFRLDDALRIGAALARRGVDVDMRDPDVLRFAPAPLFNSYHDVWRAARHLTELLSA